MYRKLTEEEHYQMDVFKIDVFREWMIVLSFLFRKINYYFVLYNIIYTTS